MEALTAVSVAALTVYDMCKAVDRGMVIDQVRLEEKTGGRSGRYRRRRRSATGRRPSSWSTPGRDAGLMAASEAGEPSADRCGRLGCPRNRC